MSQPTVSGAGGVILQQDNQFPAPIDFKPIKAYQQTGRAVSPLFGQIEDDHPPNIVEYRGLPRTAILQTRGKVPHSTKTHLSRRLGCLPIG